MWPPEDHFYRIGISSEGSTAPEGRQFVVSAHRGPRTIVTSLRTDCDRFTPQNIHLRISEVVRTALASSEQLFLLVLSPILTKTYSTAGNTAASTLCYGMAAMNVHVRAQHRGGGGVFISGRLLPKKLRVRSRANVHCWTGKPVMEGIRSVRRSIYCKIL